MLKKIIGQTTAAVLAALFFPLLATQMPAEKTSSVPASVRKTEKEYVFAKLFRTNLDPENYADPAKAADLIRQRETTVRNLLDERRKIIREDARAGQIRAQIRKLADELTVIVESREQVKKLNRALAELDSAIDTLPPRPPRPVTPDTEKNMQK